MNQYSALIFKLVQTGVKRHCDTLLLIVLSIMMRRHLFLKTYRIQDYIPKNHALFQAKMAKKTLWDCTYLYGSYRGVLAHEN